MDPMSCMIEIMRQEGAAYNGYSMEIADVLSVNPVKILVNKTEITKGIWIPQFMNGMANPAAIATSETGLKSCLNSVYQACNIFVGDKVYVQRVNDDFYILGKAVKV